MTRTCFGTGLVLFHAENVAADGSIEEPPDFVAVAGLAQYPHHLCQYSLGGHIVGLQNAAAAGQRKSGIVNGKVVNAPADSGKSGPPWEIASTSDETLPAGCPILSTIFVVDKVGVCFCDGEDNWYREADKPVAAGQPISALF